MAQLKKANDGRTAMSQALMEDHNFIMRKFDGLKARAMSGLARGSCNDIKQKSDQKKTWS